jgi:hypothetical protein
VHDHLPLTRDPAATEVVPGVVEVEVAVPACCRRVVGVGQRPRTSTRRGPPQVEAYASDPARPTPAWCCLSRSRSRWVNWPAPQVRGCSPSRSAPASGCSANCWPLMSTGWLGRKDATTPPSRGPPWHPPRPGHPRRPARAGHASAVRTTNSPREVPVPTWEAFSGRELLQPGQRPFVALLTPLADQRGVQALAAQQRALAGLVQLLILPKDPQLVGRRVAPGRPWPLGHFGSGACSIPPVCVRSWAAVIVVIGSGGPFSPYSSPVSTRKLPHQRLTGRGWQHHRQASRHSRVLAHRAYPGRPSDSTQTGAIQQS